MSDNTPNKPTHDEFMARRWGALAITAAVLMVIAAIIGSIFAIRQGDEMSVRFMTASVVLLAVAVASAILGASYTIVDYTKKLQQQSTKPEDKNVSRS